MIKSATILNGAADCVVQIEIFNLRVRPAERAGGIFRAADFTEFHVERVVDYELVGDGFADTQHFLDGFGSLQNAHRAGEHTEYQRRTLTTVDSGLRGDLWDFEGGGLSFGLGALYDFLVEAVHAWNPAITTKAVLGTIGEKMYSVRSEINVPPGAMVPLALANVLANSLLARGQFRVVPWLVAAQASCPVAVMCVSP